MINDDLVETQSYETAFWMAGIYSPDYPARLLGELAADVSNKLRGMAIFRLLSDGKTNSFYHNLIRSGLVRQRYLQRCLDENLLEDHFRSSGRYLPLFDAIATADYSLAGRVIDLSPVEFMQGHEYQDDYCYAQIAHALVTGRDERGQELLLRFERYLEGSLNGRFYVAKALLERDQSGFAPAFEQLLSDRELEIATDIKRGQIESPQIIAFRRIFVEGLAILRLAEKLGLKTEEEYLFCPSIARIPMTEAFPGE
jgi:hypothetical protein